MPGTFFPGMSGERFLVFIEIVERLSVQGDQAVSGLQARLFSASVFDQRPGNERNPPGHKFGIVNQRRDGIFGNVDPESLFTPLYGDVGSLIEHDALVDL